MKRNSIQRLWISDLKIAEYKRKVNCIVQKRYSFADWHLDSINNRPYAQEVVMSIQRYIDTNGVYRVIEVGCGLGDIIGNIRTGRKCKKIGIDSDSAVVKAATILHPSVEFCQGSFRDIAICASGGNCLIMVDFIHTISEEDLKAKIENVINTGKIDLVVFDTFAKYENTVYQYSHRGEYLLGNGYRCIRKSKGFAAAQGARRYIEYWEKTSINE